MIVFPIYTVWFTSEGLKVGGKFTTMTLNVYVRELDSPSERNAEIGTVEFVYVIRGLIVNKYPA